MAAAAAANENNAIGQETRSIGRYGRSIWDTFRPGGEFQQNLTALATSANSGGKNSYNDYLGNVATRTGSGTTPQMVAASEEATRQGKRDVATQLEQNEMQREAALEHGLETQEGMYAAIPGQYGSEYSTAIGGATGAGGNAAQAAKTPGFWDTFLPALVGGAGTAAGGYFTGGAK